MAKKKIRNTRKKIIDAAWRLFNLQGYDDTTVEEIIEESGTSRGSFYHYFQGKDSLLSTLSDFFDQRYEELVETVDPEMDRFDQMMYLNRECFTTLETSIPLELLAQLYASQLVTQGDRSLLDHNRTYYKLLRQIILQGQERGELRGDITANEIFRVYTMCQRAIIYDWCLFEGDYPLARSGEELMPIFLREFRA